MPTWLLNAIIYKAYQMNISVSANIPTVSFEHMGFDSAIAEVQSIRGTKYLKRVTFGMPKIQQELLDTVFYLYRTREDALEGKEFGGTGFMVSVPSRVKQGLDYYYAVTNAHVACRDGCSVIRFNTRDGGTDILEFDPSDWVAHPDFLDVAILSPSGISQDHKVATISHQMFLTCQDVDSYQFGPGDDVMMIGRFVDHDGGVTNKPACRFGHISIDPSPIIQYNGKEALSYCVDMHSRAGYSGSPVFVYRTSGSDLTNMNGSMSIGPSVIKLLGIHWGQFPEMWEIAEGVGKKKAAQESLITEGKYVKGLSGMTCVLPAKEIQRMLDIDEIRKVREQHEQMLMRQKNLGDTPSVESYITDSENQSPYRKKGDDLLMKMLNTPPETH
jgi:hypothetical protein